jgi:hypothetical protein
MRPDINIAIAYGSKAMREVAETLCDKLKAYQSYGYPVTVSIVAEDIRVVKNNISSGQSVETKIREKMENYFSTFDYAVFLFDSIGDAKPEASRREVDLISTNLIYEYGLASSAFINKELKHIFCFSPKEIFGDALRYVKNINYKLFEDLMDEEDAKDPEAIADTIIQDFIHSHKEGSKTYGVFHSFYGLPEKLPGLKYVETKRVRDNATNRNCKFYELELAKGFPIRNPMDIGDDNEYWADLNKLQPAGVRVSLDEKGQSLNKLFTDEYQAFSKENNDTSEFTLERQLLYIIDRAVFIMYLRAEDDWDKVVEGLYNSRLRMIGVRNKDDDYYLKAATALRGVFMYQKCSRPKAEDKPLSGSLFNKIGDIKKFLEPISALGRTCGNRMVYCMAADYLALCHLKIATKNLGDIIGKNNKEFYLDNTSDIKGLQSIFNDTDKFKEKQTALLEVLENLRKGADLFKNVIACQTEMQAKISNLSYRYIWESYALYNRARCVFMIHLIHKISDPEIVRKFPAFTEIFEDLKKIGDEWGDEMKKAIDSRNLDYVHFNEKERFPQFISFNLRAEYFHAYYEYELACLIENQINPSFTPPSLSASDSDQTFEAWKENNLTISDVLKVNEKAARIHKIKESFFDDSIEQLLQKEKIPANKKEKAREFLMKIKESAISRNKGLFDKIVASLDPSIEFYPLTGAIRLRFFS